MMKILDYVLFIDDTKDLDRRLNKITNNLVTCRTYRQAIAKLDEIYADNPNAEVFVCLDYHLGKLRSGTGYDVARHIVINKYPISGFTIVSIYSEGRDLIGSLLIDRYHYEKTIADVVDYYLNYAEVPVEDIQGTIPEEIEAPEFSLIERAQTWIRARVSAWKEIFTKFVENFKNL